MLHRYGWRKEENNKYLEGYQPLMSKLNTLELSASSLKDGDKNKDLNTELFIMEKTAGHLRASVYITY